MARLSVAEYINVTYQMIQEEGYDNVSIRKIADRLKCSSASLYKHFDGLEHLMCMASLRFFRPYVEEIQEICHQGKKYDVDTYFQTWECFARHSFANPQVYNSMFFGQYSFLLDTSLKQYYNIYDSEITAMDEATKPIFILGDLSKRNVLSIENCMGELHLEQHEYDLINKLTLYLYKGILKTILDSPRASPKAYVEDFSKGLNTFLMPILSKNCP